MIRLPNRLATKWFAVLLVGLTVVASGYFAVTGVVDPGALLPGGDSHAARLYAGYLFVRSAILLAALVWFAVRREWRTLALLLVLNGLVQAGDAVLGVIQHDAARIIGPASFAAALLVVGAGLRRTAAR
jgi:hypothetical protein